MNNFTLEQIKNAMKKKGYAFFEDGDYNLNLIGIRNSKPVPNTFDDIFAIVYKEKGQWKLWQFPCTTDPGTYWLKNPSRVEGTAILVPGQYKASFQIGLHKGKYKALRQCKPVALWRDNDRDNLAEAQKTVHWEMTGINIHRANEYATSMLINSWSAGCQVIANPAHYKLFMELLDKAEIRYSDKFTYTLLTQSDIE